MFSASIVARLLKRVETERVPGVRHPPGASACFDSHVVDGQLGGVWISASPIFLGGCAGTEKLLDVDGGADRFHARVLHARFSHRPLNASPERHRRT